MKHLKLFFALFAMLALGVGNAWGAEATVYTSNVELNTTDGSKAYASKAKIANVEYSAMKLGSSGNSGNFYVNLPANTTSLTLHAAAWNGKNSNTLTLSSETAGVTISPNTAQTLTANSGVSGSSTTYTITPDNTKEFFTFSLTGATSGAKIKLACSERCLIWGVNAETAGGGENPGEGGDEDPETPGAGGSGSIVIKYNSNFTPVLPTTKDGANATSTEHTVENLTIKEQGLYNNGSGYIMFVQGKGFLYNTQSLGTITSVSVTYTSGTSTTGKAGVYFGSTEQSTHTTTSNQTIKGQSQTDTWTNTTEGNGFFQLSTSSKNVQITQIEITYKSGSEGGGTEEPVVSLKLDQTSLKLNKGTTATLTATVENSEDPITWSSDKPSVATIANGVVTAVGKGTATITASVGEVKATCSVEVIEITGAGTEENPYTATDIITLGLNDKTKAWVEGYIIGVMENNNKLVANTTSTNSNIVLADAADATENYVPVALPSGDVRIALNLKDNSSNLGKKVAVYGTLETYFTLPGVKSVSEYKWIVEEGELAAPTITPAGGTYYEAQNVTISAEEGTTVYYTLDGNNPTTSSNVYSTPIQIAETATLKAIAVKGEKTSPVASENYTINLPLTTMDAIFAKATAVGSNATSVQVVMNNWVITGVKGSNAYLTDGTKGLIIYTTSHGFEVGDVLSGTVECKVQLYNGSSELKELTSATTGLNVTKGGGTVDPVVLDAAGIADLKGVNTGSVIKINGVATSSDVVAGVKLYNTLFSFTDLTVQQEYNVTGVYLQYYETQEILPRSEADIEMVEGLPSAIIEVENITMEVDEEKTISATTTPVDAQVTYTIKSGTCVTLDGATIKAVSEGTAIITASVAEKAGEYKGATKDFTVTVKTPEQALTDWVLTSAADITINDLVVITMTKGETTWAMSNDNGTSAAPAAPVVTLSADALAAQPAENLKWVVANESGNITIYPYGGYESWLYCTNTNNGVKVGNNDSKIFKIDAESGYLKHEGTSRFIGVYNAQDWRCYTNTTGNIAGQTLAFYVKKNANDVLPGTGEEPGDDPDVPTPTINPTATFIFNTAEGLDDLGIIYPATADEDTEGAYKTEFVDNATYTQDGITMTTTNGTSIPTRVWLTKAGKLDLRIYNGASLTLSVGDNLVISNVVFTGKGISNLIVDGVAVSNNSWAGHKQSVTFDVTATTNIYTIAITVSYTRSISANYGTICLPYGSSNYSGAEFYEFVGKETGKVWLASVDKLEAGVPYVFMVKGAQLVVAYEGTPVSDPGKHNGLHGTFTDNTPVAEGNYIISQGKVLAPCGTGCYVNANRAYIVMGEIPDGKPTQQMPGRKYIGMDVQGENVETGIEDIFTTDTPVKVIENGQLIIIRDGVKYNVQGQKL